MTLSSSEDNQQSSLATADGWLEPIQRVQLLAESGISVIPTRYVRPESERALLEECEASKELEIQTIDLSGLEDEKRRRLVLAEIRHACEGCGFFQILNHGIPLSLLRRALLVSQQFFDLPLEEKQCYANDPITYEGYGSRLGTDKGAILDWGDYFYAHVFPTYTRNPSKWPSKPTLWRETMEEYGQHIANLASKLLEAISASLDLSENTLNKAFGEAALAFRVNYYPPCPQPELTLGVSSHSDPGGLTILLQTEGVSGLQVRRNDKWVTVDPLSGALIVNLGDQLQIISNGMYKSVEHRALVNRYKARVSIASFFNPCHDEVISPLPELCSAVNPPRYQSMKYSEYRSFIRRNGTRGKVYVDSVQSSTPKTM